MPPPHTFFFTGGLYGKTTWNPAVTVWSGVGLPVWCSFGGVTCNIVSGSATYGRVVGIDVSSAWMSGSLPSTIGNLKAMQILKLNDNVLVGSIPSSIGTLTALTYLSLASNMLTGTIPSSIGGLLSLTNMNLGTNSITGSLPSSLSVMTKLRTVYLNTNSLVGTIPNLSALKSARTMYLHTNYISMGILSTVPSSTFSTTTLNGKLRLENNCLSFLYGLINVSPTHCI